MPEAVIVGAGPNGLGAAIELARHGVDVQVLEAAAEPGGGARSGGLTRPGFVHDLCSAIHPMAAISPFFRSLGLEDEGLRWVHSPSCVAHALPGSPSVALRRSVRGTADGLDVDVVAYERWIRPLLDRWPAITEDVLRPLRVPRHPLTMLRFAASALRPARSLACARFSGTRARALFAGIAAHSVRPLTGVASAAVGVVLQLAGHVAGWPFPRGGSARITRALVDRLSRLGGEVRTDWRLRDLGELPRARAVLLALTPRQVIDVAGGRLPARYARRLRRYRYGPGVFKLDWALSGPIPWADPELATAATVHVGGHLEDVVAATRAPHRGEVAREPFVVLAQPSLFDETRAPEGAHTAWAYCHVPNGWSGDLTDVLEERVERHAPGFRDVILERVAWEPSRLEARNPNLVGGDIGAGAATLWQTLFRPVPRWDPYSTPVDGLYLCGASTPPGGGVHGLCGALAAQRVLEREFGVDARPWSS